MKTAAAALGIAILALCSCEAVAQVRPPPVSEAARKLAEYEEARAKFEDEAASYWQAIADKRRARIVKRRNRESVSLDDYVLTQPPVYAGPPRPPEPEQPGRPPRQAAPVPVVADFLGHAREQFGFVPDRPNAEADFKAAYAQYARRAGLAREQIVRVYVFEAGGNGAYDVQAGLEGRNTRAISTALGYNQLLNTNTVGLLAENGEKFLTHLNRKLTSLRGPAARRLEEKIQILKKMIAFTRTVPNQWSAHDVIANTPQGLGIHALNLDIDVGPLLQTQKLLDSVNFATARQYGKTLTAAELEMMNLTGDGNGLDMISLPGEMRQEIPTSNFFQRRGYERNPVAARNNTVAKLIAATDAKMDREQRRPGAEEMSKLYLSGVPR